MHEQLCRAYPYFIYLLQLTPTLLQNTTKGTPTLLQNIIKVTPTLLQKHYLCTEQQILKLL